jgi:glutamine amidotransferase
MRVTMFDYGAGNLHSLSKAIAKAGVEVRIESDPAAVVDSDALVLPGVGAFSSAARQLAAAGETIRDALLDGLPCLGICLGMQLLLDKSQEGEGKGLGVIPGSVKKLKTRRTPHIGWNEVTWESDSVLETTPLGLAYFAHSFICHPTDRSHVVAWTTHENERFAAALRFGNIFGVQFHPEKSSAAGVSVIASFIEAARP